MNKIIKFIIIKYFFGFDFLLQFIYYIKCKGLIEEE